ncbi:hypothetical protein [Streptomyces sp. SID3343]|uniref:hypothetical protein n=1 Tax=Streptomyces sp. SID3343 TaxID=2690260 RepID=UPI00136FB3EE|nr:hypothetical protein [Streptomyces sp. SID3343]MYW06199.1 hypothetical protein [Streptomyces sp. SID3343]
MTRLTHGGDSTFAPVARLASAHSVLASLASEFGDEIVASADTADASPLSRRTTAVLTAAAADTSRALAQLASAIHDTADVDERPDLPRSAGNQQRAEWHTHIDYRLHQVATILSDTAHALRRGTEEYSHPYPSVRVESIKPVPDTILTPTGATYGAAACQRSTAATSVPLPTP